MSAIEPVSRPAAAPAPRRAALRNEPAAASVAAAAREVPLKPSPRAAAAKPAAARRFVWPSLDALSWASLAVLLWVVVCALVPHVLAPYAPTDMNADAILSAPNASHWFGTDQFGRDVFSLVIFGARQSLSIGVSAVLIGASLGVSIGLVAGYVGGKTDMVLMRVTDIWMAVPRTLLAISLAIALGTGLVNTIIAISLADVPRYARVLRGQAIAIRHRPFIEAARAAGASHFAIVRGHLLPHCAAPILVLATLGIATCILQGATLSFLGLGVNDERPDWGYLLTQGRGYLTVAWWIVTYPGLAITLLVVSVNLLGDGLRRRFDPRNEPR